MKKLLSIVLCFALLAAMAVSVAAAGGASFSVSASNSTPRRGDTITFAVAVASGEPATSYGLQLSYDSAALELVGGNCVVSGAMVSSFNNGFAFMFQTPTAYSGTVGTVSFRVKDQAAFGSYTVSGSASVMNGSTPVSASGASATIIVSCAHSYGGWTKVNDSTHMRTCTVCNTDETENHAWNAGSVTRQPTCKDAGEKTVTCTVCQATKSESVAKTTEHKYGSWVKVSDTAHKHTCSVCGKEETANHTWNSGSVTKQPTCREAGEKTVTCTACRATKTESVAKTNDHKYGSWSKVNDTTHRHTCSVCAKEETESHTWNSGVVTRQPSCVDSGTKVFTCTMCNATKNDSIPKLTVHTYDHACDKECNVCGAAREVAHSYKTAWSKDRIDHWYECTVCKVKKDVAKHTPGGEATETKAQTCTTCGYVMKAALGHEHSYTATWSTDDAGHWYSCSGCEEKKNDAPHDFENACDNDCATCGYTRTTEHRFKEIWQTNQHSHWLTCAGCGLKDGEATHEPGPAATATTAQTCTICSFQIAPALDMVENNEITETPVVEAANQNEPANAQFPLWIVLCAAVVILLAAPLLLLIRKIVRQNQQ